MMKVCFSGMLIYIEKLHRFIFFIFLHFFKRSSDNQNPMLSPNGSTHVIDYNNKKVCIP